MLATTYRLRIRYSNCIIYVYDMPTSYTYTIIVYVYGNSKVLKIHYLFIYLCNFKSIKMIPVSFCSRKNGKMGINLFNMSSCRKLGMTPVFCRHFHYSSFFSVDCIPRGQCQFPAVPHLFTQLLIFLRQSIWKARACSKYCGNRIWAW